MKKIIISEKSIILSDSGEKIPAIRQVRDLIRSVLWQENFNWMDGFLIFKTWRDGNQTGEYLQQFRSLAAKASKALIDKGIKGARITRIAETVYKEYWRFERRPESNIDQAILSQKKACEYFVKGDEKGWDSISQAIKEANDCIDPGTICQTIFLADKPPKEKCIDNIQEIIRSYRKALVKAIVRVGDKASKKDKKQRQGLDFGSAADALARWIIEIVQINEVLDLFTNVPKLVKDSISSDVEEFMRLARMLAEYEPETNTMGDICVRSSGGVCQSIGDELDVNMLQKRLIECAFVNRIATDIKDFYEARPWFRVTPNEVNDSLNYAVFYFAHKFRDVLDSSDKVERCFRKFLKGIVSSKCAKEKLSLEIFAATDKSLKEKEKQLLSILEKIKGTDSLEVSEVEQIASVIRDSGHSIHLKSKVQCFQTVEEVLEVKNPSPPEWFRPLGPVFSDFENQRVYRRSIVDKLKKNVHENLVYLLEGDAATGKSIIVRYLMYELFEKDDESRVYYLDIAQKRYFDADQLIKDIQITKGIFIIENIHLDPYKIQWIYTKIKNDPENFAERNVLFTSRTLDENLLNKYEKVLSMIAKTTTKPFEEVNDLIDFYCAHPEIPDVVSKMRKDIIGISSESFWLLAFALQGCKDADGKGEPRNWIGDKVREYLDNLDNLDERYDKYAECYSRILLALCPLYKSEILTAESYLTEKLKFIRPALKALTKRGEITRHKDADKNVFYGLHHSALAEAYWEHGEEYRKNMPQYEVFMYNYALSNVPNALEAIDNAEPPVRERLIARLDTENELEKIIERESSVQSVMSWCLDTDRDIVSKENILVVVARRMDDCDDPEGVCHFLWELCDDKLGRRLWSLLDKEKVGSRVVGVERIQSVVSYLRPLFYRNKIVSRELCGLLNTKALLEAFNHTKVFRDLLDYISSVLRTNPKVGRRLWKLLDKKLLADRLSRSKYIWAGQLFFGDILAGDPKIAHDFCNLLSIKELVRTFDRLELTEGILTYVAIIGCANASVGRKLWRAVCKKWLAGEYRRVCRDDVFSLGDQFILADKHLAGELCNFVDIKEEVERLNDTENIERVGEYFKGILYLNDPKGCEIWRFLDKENLAFKCSRSKGFQAGLRCVDKLGQMREEMAYELCGLLNINDVAASLNQSEQPYHIKESVCELLRIHPEKGRQLRKRLNKKVLASIKSRL